MMELVSRIARVLRLWFGVTEEVNQARYAASGVGLTACKYIVEAGAICHFTGRFFSPLDFVNPLLSLRQEYFRPPAPEWLPWVVFFWSVPFLWVAVTMSVRRSANAGINPWLGLLVLLPLVNLFVMILFCCLPESRHSVWLTEGPEQSNQHQLRSALAGIAAGIVVALVMAIFSVYVLRDYGATLFLGSPVVMGAVSAFVYNRPYPRSLSTSLGVALASVVFAGGALILFAFEGVLCLAMLFPVAAAMAMLGGLIGYMLGAQTPTRAITVTCAAITLPLFAGAESRLHSTPIYEVITTIEIDAPPDQVWPHVIGFSELPEPPGWYFQLGVAYPKRATIDGAGVGAVRHCEFSTGAFVEPVTHWEPPRRLAFDVASQPPPMHELSPYRHIHPPHLDGYLRCQRGEFRLIELPDGRTRLEGSTWYELEMFPQNYWTLWTDGVIHQIHRRVLARIKLLAEGKVQST